MLRLLKLFFAPTSLVVLVAATGLSTGCERKERVVDIRTPAGEVHVDRDRDTGDVEVNVHDK